MGAEASGVPRTVGGRYTIGDLIGRGGDAEVYRARDELLGRNVAVKLFPADPGDVDESRRWNEVLTAASLSHPGLVTLHDIGREGDRWYFVMQLVEGGSLDERLRRGPLSIGDVITLGSALADALAYVHRHRGVHRDITPGNVLFDDDERPYLSGFGVALVTGTGSAARGAWHPIYASPERRQDQPVGPASDVWELGTVLLECLRPDRGLRAGRRGAVTTSPDAPDALAALLADMVLDDPAARPTAERVGRELRMLPHRLAAAPPGVGARAVGPAPRMDGVFISYRRATSWQLARLVHDDLVRAGYDVFMDVTHLNSGNFDRQVLEEIEKRAHFVVVLQPATRFDGSGDRIDWMRREIAHALELDRNVVPVMSDGFAFGRDAPLPADIARLATANGVTIYPDYVDEALTRLQSRFLTRSRADPIPSRPPTPERSPAPPVEATILPGQGAAGVLLGDDPERVREVLGEAEQYLEHFGSLWPSIGLELRGLGKTTGSVRSIALLRRREGSFRGRTPEGISVMSTMDDVRGAYGEPASTGGRMLEYPALGANFWFDGSHGHRMQQIVIGRPREAPPRFRRAWRLGASLDSHRGRA